MIPPGATALTRTPEADHSQAAVSVSVSMPPRAAPEWANSGPPGQEFGDEITIGAAMGLHPGVVDFAHEDKAAGQVVADHGLEAPGRNGLHRRAKLAAGIVDQSVDPAVRAKHRIHRGNDHRLVADIADMAGDPAAVLLDLGLDLGELFGGASQDRDVGAECCELMRGAATDAAAAAGDDNGPIPEQIGPKDGLVGHRVLRADFPAGICPAGHQRHPLFDRSYFPRNTGLRFSRNAFTPSCASAVRAVAARVCASSSIWLSSERFGVCKNSRLMPPKASVG